MIDITKPVRTKNGQSVEIISNKGRDVFALLGYFGTSQELDRWTMCGKYYGPKSTSLLDLENYEPEPQPEPKPEEWAAEKAAFAVGKVIQYYAKGLGEWEDINGNPLWAKGTQYRIKPEPQWVQLGPEDAPPGSVIRGPLWGDHSWSSINVSDFGVIWLGIDRLSNGVSNHEMSWGRLMESGFEVKRPGEDWKPCKKEASE